MQAIFKLRRPQCQCVLTLSSRGRREQRFVGTRVNFLTWMNAQGQLFYFCALIVIFQHWVFYLVLVALTPWRFRPHAIQYTRGSTNQWNYVLLSLYVTSNLRWTQTLQTSKLWSQSIKYHFSRSRLAASTSDSPSRYNVPRRFSSRYSSWYYRYSYFELI